MGEEMMEIPVSYKTAEGFLMELMHSTNAISMEDAHEKMRAADMVGLKTMIIPINILGNRIKYVNFYELHFYKATEIESEESK